MATANVIAATDGYIFGYDASDYYTARELTTGSGASATYHAIGQFISDGFYVTRSFMTFTIPAMSALASASLFLNGKADGSTSDFDVDIFASTYSALDEARYDEFTGWKASGTYDGTKLNDAWSSSSYSADWNEIAFNAAGLAAILAKSGTTFKIALLSHEDTAESQPTNDEYVEFRSSATSGEEPYLALNYTEPSSVTFIPTSSMRRGICGGIGRGI